MALTRFTSIWLSGLACFASASPMHQEPLTDGNTESHSLVSAVGLPIYRDAEYFGIPSYYTKLEIGPSTSAQNISASFDLQWSNTWVASTNCNTSTCRHFPSRYNPDLSDSFVNDGTPAKMFNYPIGQGRGRLAYENFRLGGNLVIENHKFVELLVWGPQEEPTGWWPWKYDAALGLSLALSGFYNTSQTKPLLPGVVRELMTDLGVRLEKSCFSLLLPKEDGQVGDLSFGHVNDNMYEGKLISHPIHPSDAELWQIEGPVIQLRAQNGTTLATYDLTNNAAYLDTGDLGEIMLPSQVQSKIVEVLGAQYDGEVECGLVGTYPHLVFIFGDQEISLGESYIRQEYGLFGVEPCRAAISAMPGPENEFYWSLYNQTTSPTLVLGTPFLQAVYSVYDWEKRTVSFAKSVL